MEKEIIVDVRKTKVANYKGILPFWEKVEKVNMKKDSVTYFVCDHRPYLRHLAKEGSITAYTMQGLAIETSKIEKHEVLCYYVRLISKAWYVENIKIAPAKSDAMILIY